MARLVLIGSGETAPTLIKVHRQLLSSVDTSTPGAAGLVDTTFSFQTNAEELIAKTQRYFAESVGLSVNPIRWPRADLEPLPRANALTALSQVRWLFAGPGSPSHTVRQWLGTEFVDVLHELSRTEATLIFGSAAACTVGAATLPVYEMYKAGQDPFLLEGLDLLQRLSGLSAIVIPHFDNAEGDSYDTRFCYLGAQRLRTIRSLLAPGTGVMGVDEHTAVVVEPDEQGGSGQLTVLGHGALTLLGPLHADDPANADAVVVRSGSSISWEAAARLLSGSGHATAGTVDNLDLRDDAVRTLGTAQEGQVRRLADVTELARSQFEPAERRGDIDSCVNAVLELAHAIEDWSNDSRQSADLGAAHRTLRLLISRLGTLAESGPQIREQHLASITPLLDGLLLIRERARSAKDFATADEIRKLLASASITVRDTPTGSSWTPT